MKKVVREILYDIEKRREKQRVWGGVDAFILCVLIMILLRERHCMSHMPTMLQQMPRWEGLEELIVRRGTHAHTAAKRAIVGFTPTHFVSLEIK
jgi:hypothetical protein